MPSTPKGRTQKSVPFTTISIPFTTIASTITHDTIDINKGTHDNDIEMMMKTIMAQLTRNGKNEGDNDDTHDDDKNKGMIRMIL